MRHRRLLAALTVLAGSAALAGCAEDYGYGYGGATVGYASRGYCDPYYYDCGAYRGYDYGYGWNGYYGDPYWGWWGNYYYPGIGFYVYDRYGRRSPWDER